MRILHEDIHISFLHGNNMQCWSRDRRCGYAAVWLSFRLSSSNIDVALLVSTCSCKIVHQLLLSSSEVTASKVEEMPRFDVNGV
jgi:hypothetical protein